MCGIAGLMTLTGTEPEVEAVRCMGETLGHRGPDGEGDYFGPGIGLIHRRLAIIDLETGKQPLFHPAGFCLVANGEIYNYVELRKQFDQTKFLTQSDCEIPLYLYDRDGERYATGLRGMYAIALFDKIDRRLLLSRDPFGIKPLYYCEGSFGFAFASEPRAFFESGLCKPILRREAARELLQLQFTVGSSTAFENIFRVLPGETLVIEAGRIVRRHFTAALPKNGPVKVTLDVAVAEVERTLQQSVLVHQRSDVPYGMFLSGGVDSSTLLLQMTRLTQKSVKAYTIGFPDTNAVDEREHARNVALALGADHVEVEFTENDFWRLTPKIINIMDDPVADYAALPTYKLAERAAKDVKVILSGEGGDEIFGGYGRYRSVVRPWHFLKRAMRSKGALSGLGLLRDDNRDWRQGMITATELATSLERSPLQIAQATDCSDWLAHDLLLKLDRCLMAVGVEGRTPMLDTYLAESIFLFPDSFKIKGKSGKWILRKWLESSLPVSKPFSRKRGFSVPVGEWISRKGDILGPLVAMQPVIAEFCDPETVKRVFNMQGKREGFASWILLFFALWYKRHIEGQMLDGDVFDCLRIGAK